MIDHVMLKIINCVDCPNCAIERTLHAGCASDYICTKVIDLDADHGRKVIAGYCESASEQPQDNKIPTWCPLVSGEVKDMMRKEISAQIWNAVQHHFPDAVKDDRVMMYDYLIKEVGDRFGCTIEVKETKIFGKIIKHLVVR